MDIPRVRVSDQLAFLACRRAWYHRSRLGLSLQPRYQDNLRFNLWFGSGWHYALESYYRIDSFADQTVSRSAYMKDRFREYCRATIAVGDVPDWESIESYVRLAEGMIDHYIHSWLRRRTRFRTLVIDGVVQVEVPYEWPMITPSGQAFLMCGTFDGIVVDPMGGWWIIEYKTAKQFNTLKLANDYQTSVYTAIGREIYGDRIKGVLYVQFRKEFPEAPRILTNGDLSVAKDQNTTYDIYHAAVIQRYGRVTPKYAGILDTLESREDANGDPFIRWDMIERDAAECQQALNAVRVIAGEQLRARENTELLYPTPTWQCGDCTYRLLCIELSSAILGYEARPYKSMVDQSFESLPPTDVRPWQQWLIRHQEDSGLDIGSDFAVWPEGTGREIW
jgi:hypothetical protein